MRATQKRQLPYQAGGPWTLKNYKNIQIFIKRRSNHWRQPPSTTVFQWGSPYPIVARTTSLLLEPDNGLAKSTTAYQDAKDSNMWRTKSCGSQVLIRRTNTSWLLSNAVLHPSVWYALSFSFSKPLPGAPQYGHCGDDTRLIWFKYQSKQLWADKSCVRWKETSPCNLLKYLPISFDGMSLRVQPRSLFAGGIAPSAFFFQRECVRAFNLREAYTYSRVSDSARFLFPASKALQHLSVKRSMGGIDRDARWSLRRHRIPCSTSAYPSYGDRPMNLL